MKSFYRKEFAQQGGGANLQSESDMMNTQSNSKLDAANSMASSKITYAMRADSTFLGGNGAGINLNSNKSGSGI